MKTLIFLFLESSSTKYGLEALVIKYYEAFSNNKMKYCGLFIDEELCFLAFSPDAFIEDEGVSVQCPSSAEKRMQKTQLNF